MANLALRTLANDVYLGKNVKFEEKTGAEAINEALLKAVGGKWNYKNFRKHKYDAFEIMEDVLALPMGKELTTILNKCVEIEDQNLGDKKVWKVPSVEKFKVAKIASGHQDLRRQRIGQDRVIEFSTEWFGIKIYEEFENLVSGRIDFGQLITNVRESFEKHIATMVTLAVFDSYTSLSAGKFYVEGAVTTTNLSQLISRVETKTGMKCAVYGSKTSLSKIADKQLANASDAMKHEYGSMGYIGKFEGTDLIELPQSLDNEDNFEVPDDMLIVIPIGLKTIKVVFEGEPIVNEGEELSRNDLQKEYVFMRKMGIGVAISNYHGVYKITA